ncbi:hypothetical protein MTO96_030832 [Rhipicephalus appendiculatus]
MSAEAVPPDEAGNDSNDHAPQEESPGEITLYGSIDHLNVPAEHKLLQKPAAAEHWDDFLSTLDHAILTVRKAVNIPEVMNWRPTAFGSRIDKLYEGCLA